MNQNASLLEKLEEHLSLFKKMYDTVRLVDPLRKKVIDCCSEQRQTADDACYDYWKKGEICNNCISVRAYLQNKCYIKFEQQNDQLIVVTAFPLENTDPPVIIELLKNATESMLPEESIIANNSKFGFFTQINDLIAKDKLTGLYNRRYIDERLPADIVRATLERIPLSVIFIDVDNLKEINDSYGHLCGDKAIVEIANIISECIDDSTDWAARYGGDEFFICLNHVNSKDAYKTAEAIRQKTAKLKISASGQTIFTSLSLGVYTVQNSSLTAEEIIALADHRMYEAKRSGKNNTVGFNKYQ